jgi:MarR family transcriptional regulator, transcriptional regulator for hemolysin
VNENNRNRARFAQLVISISRLWRRQADQALADCGMSQAMALPLLVLTRNDHARLGAIAEELALEGPSLVRIVDLLVAEKLVTRKEDASDRRAKILSLTEKGRARGLEIERVVDDLRQRFLSKIGRKELAVTMETLEKVEGTLLTLAAKNKGDE